MRVKIEHLIAFYENRIEKRKLNIESSNKEYQSQKIKYEAKFFPKLFGWKFENSTNGSTSWFSSWPMLWDEDHIKWIGLQMNKLEYHKKLNEIYIDWGYNKDAFYKFCKNNNIPF